jgi:PAS domain S-box-containing protein
MLGRVRKTDKDARQDQSSPADPVGPGIAESERRFRNLVEGSIEGVLIQRNDKVLFANQALADMLGFDSVADFLQIESVDAYIHPEDRNFSQRYRSDRLDGATPPADYELRALRKDGSATWLSCRAMIVDWDGEPASQSFLYDIDERKRVESALNAARALMQQVYANISESVLVIDVKTRTIIGGNPAMEQMFGYCEEELIGLDVEVLCADKAQFTEVRKALLEELDGGGLFEAEMDLLRDDGTVFPSALTVSEIPAEDSGRWQLVCVIRDITERKRAENVERRHREELEGLVRARTYELARERDTLDNYMSLANAVFMVIDTQARIRLINRHALELLGYREDEVIGRNWFDLMVPGVERSRRVAIFEAWVLGTAGLSSEDAFTRESPVIAKDGSERLWSWRNRLIRDDAGQVMALVCTAEDITERRRYEAELQQLRRVETLGAVSAGIAHSLGNLLQPIMALTDMMMNNLGDEERNWKRLQAMSQANGRARTLVDRLLAFSRRDTPSWRELDLNNMMHQVFSLYRYSLPKQITLQENLCETPCKIYADPIQLESMLLNLVNNAAAAIGENRGRIAVTLDCASADVVRIAIEDDGPGMAPKVLEQAFQPFFTTKQAGEGAGLGLSMVKSIVDEYGGSVQIESEPGIGTKVAVMLPRRLSATST